MRCRALPVILALVPVLVGQTACAQPWNGQQFGSGQSGSQQFQQSQFGQQQFGQQQFGHTQFQPVNNGIGGQPGTNTPMLNSQMSSMASTPLMQNGQQFTPSVPGTPGEPGVDILDESLKYHNMGAQNPGLHSAFNQPRQSNGFSGSDQNSNSGNQNFAAGNSNASLMSKPLFGSAGLFQTGGAAPSSTNGAGGLNTQTVGAIGAAALLGTFLNNGGVGGMIKSVGWDNSRHMRGASGF